MPRGAAGGGDGCEISRDMRESWKQDKKKKKKRRQSRGDFL